MNLREAKVEDIPQIQVVRKAVKENTLSDPSPLKCSRVKWWLLHIIAVFSLPPEYTHMKKYYLLIIIHKF